MTAVEVAAQAPVAAVEVAAPAPEETAGPVAVETPPTEALAPAPTSPPPDPANSGSSVNFISLTTDKPIFSDFRIST